MEKFYKQRVDFYNHIEKILNKYTNLCLKMDEKGNRYIYDYSKNTPIISLEKLLGSPERSKDGESYLSCVLEKNKCNQFLATKIIPIKKMEYNIIEVKIMEKLNKIVLDKGCPNFNIMYDNFICEHKKNFEFSSKQIKDKILQITEVKKINKNVEELNQSLTFIPKLVDVFVENVKLLKDTLDTVNEKLRDKLVNLKEYDTKSLIIMNELADYDLATFLGNQNNFESIEEEIENIIFQLSIALEVMYKNNIIHLDLHAGNIFMNEFNKKTDIVYKSNDELIGISTKYLVKVSDFGRSYILSNDIPDFLINKIYREMCRFYPANFNKDDLKKKEIFTKNVKKIGKVFFYIYDAWRILKNIILILKNKYNMKKENLDRKKNDLLALAITLIGETDNLFMQTEKVEYKNVEKIYKEFLLGVQYETLKKTKITNKNDYYFIS